MKPISYDAWPEFSYPQFKSTGYLLHMTCQAVGKLKLTTPFQPHWANVALWLTSRGLTTGLIAYQKAGFSVDLDLIEHSITVSTTWGFIKRIPLVSASVAELTQQFFALLKEAQIEIKMNTMPQEIMHPIAFEKDTQKQEYNKALANAWWRILVSSHRVLKRYHSHFDGETPPIGLMWGTFDLRDARYNGKSVPTTGVNSDYIRRNAMNEAQVEAGWWAGNEAYPQAAYFSFTYPQPKDIENAKVKPAAAFWHKELGEFVLNYNDLRQSNDPDAVLLEFFETTYQVGSELAGWNTRLNTTGEPV